MKQPVIIGSRGSDLALWQANYTRQLLKSQGVESQINIIKTRGDEIQHLGFDKMEGKGFFTKEIETALLAGDIDLAIHSHKDLETRSPEGLVIAAVSERAAPSELLLMHPQAHDPMLPLGLKKNAVVGTSAARRKAQLHTVRPDFEIKDLRGNVPTRIQKLRDGNYDAILVAQAGVERLNLQLKEFIVNELDPRDFIPAPSQGALALQVRESDVKLRELLKQVSDRETEAAIHTERRVLRRINGGCQIPFGAYAVHENEGHDLHFWAFYAQKEGLTPRRVYLNVPSTDFSDERVLHLLREKLNKRVLITRKMDPEGLAFNMLKDAGVDLIQQSFIEVVPLNATAPQLKDPDWVFFTSPSAVQHFAHFDLLPSTTRYAAVGKGTMRALQQRQIAPDFIGLGSPTEVGAVFRVELGSGSAIVVSAKNSLRSIQNALAASNVEVCDVYETQLRPVEFEQSVDVIAFTSPSNVHAWIEKNSITQQTRVVSIGPSTESTLQEYGIDSVMAWESSEQALADTILGVLV